MVEVASLAIIPYQEQPQTVTAQVRLIIAQVASLAVIQDIVLPQTVTARAPKLTVTQVASLAVLAEALPLVPEALPQIVTVRVL
jgi:hypothetical protein